MASDIKSLKKCIIKGEYKSAPSSYSVHLHELIGKCLKINIEERPSAE